LKCNVIEDGLLATTYGFSLAIDEYDFRTPIETGMGPDRLSIPIRNEIKEVLKEANEFKISDATWKKIFAYDEDAHKGYSREQLAKEFHAAPATIDMMLLYGHGGMTSLDADNSNQEEGVTWAHMVGMEEDGFFYAELVEVLNKVLDDDQRTVFDNVFFNGMTYKETAELLNLPERKVKYLFELCRKKLMPYYDTGKGHKRDRQKKIG
jgi:RNA polymerase sigma factor (sigma-70 family)